MTGEDDIARFDSRRYINSSSNMNFTAKLFYQAFIWSQRKGLMQKTQIKNLQI